MSELEIIGVPQSNFVRTVRIACEEKQVPYRLTPGVPRSPEVNAIHPLGKIPVMRHGGFTLCESKAIATYIDRVFPGPRLFPDDPMRCAKIEQWVSIANTVIIPAMNAYLRCYFFPKGAGGGPDRAVIDKTLPGVRVQMDVCNRAVAQTGHLVGADFSYADMNLLPVLAYLHECPESGEILDAAKELAQYFAGHSARASFKATVPPPFSELRLGSP
ncbi:MAG: glutathione S-transferase family protein [Steroidobacteraceae bacterium]